MKYICLLFFSCIHLPGAHGQRSVTVYGQVTDSVTGEALIGASVRISETTGTTSDNQGYYSVICQGDSARLTFQYAAYNSQTKVFLLGSNDSILADIRLSPSLISLNEIVISAGRYEQKLSDVMVSMEIIKPDIIQDRNTTSLEAILKQASGVDIIDGQPSIRGGSGYSYGAGSRVLVLIDDLPILSADAGDVKWDYLPVENISQVEIIKGASSVLFGSSALNGVFNIRTAYPSSGSSTRVGIFGAMYLNPARDEMVWRDSQPVFAGMDFLHARKTGRLDLVLGGNAYYDEGYKEDEYDKRIRLNANLNYLDRKVKGLSYGMGFNGMVLEKSDFFLWQNADSGAYRQNQDAVAALTGNRFNIDPFIKYIAPKGGQHSLKSRYYHISNDLESASEKNSRSDLFFGEYKYHRQFNRIFIATMGLSETYSRNNAALYGNHTSSNTAVFAQADIVPVTRMKVTAGIRMERYALDGGTEFSRPVIRTGITYQVFTYTFLRASFGQGYRFPSIAEKFTATSLASLRIFPNPDLRSELGWSAEAGVKQGIRLGSWDGYADLAVFWTEYSEMIEFRFDQYGPSASLEDFGFKALNVGHTRITGIDVSLYGKGNVFLFPVSIMAGYTYMVPVNLKDDGSLPKEEGYLKYRYRHSVKADLEVSYWRFAAGASMQYNSKMERIDEVFLDPLFGELILPGFRDYWDKHHTGWAVLDLRLKVEVTGHISLSVVAGNVLNKEYMPRPGNIQAPRNVAIRLNLDW